MVEHKVKRVNVFGGGLALYAAGAKIVSASSGHALTSFGLARSSALESGR